MALYTTIIPFILQQEGGLSKATTDAASADPLPDGSGYHTNKGITWTTFKMYLSALGISDMTTAIARFYAMSQSDWNYIFKTGYWDKILGDQINSQGAANTLVDWAWGSGPGTAVKKLQQFLNTWLPAHNAPSPNLTTDGGMGNLTLSALNAATRINEAQFISDFSDYKKSWYLSLPGESANYAGWAARLDDLKQFALSTTGKAVIGGLVLVIGLVTFFFTNSSY
jgi:lysozyme family protein